MASTIEIFLAGIALMINTIALMIMYFVTNVFYGPFVKVLDGVSASIGGPLQIGEYTWIFPYIFALRLIMEIICIVAFIVVSGRRVTYDTE